MADVYKPFDYCRQEETEVPTALWLHRFPLDLNYFWLVLLFLVYLCC